MAGCSVHPVEKQGTEAIAVQGFTLPQPPVAVSGAQEKASWIAEHFWDTYNFADTTLVASEATEQAVADFLNIAVAACPESANRGIHAAMVGSVGHEAARYRFAELFEKYLYDPTRPIIMRSCTRWLSIA